MSINLDFTSNNLSTTENINAHDAQSGNAMMKVAEGAVSSTIEILRTLKEKVINATTETNKDIDRDAIQKEIDASVQQIDDNALLTFNGKFLGNGSRNIANSLNSKNGLYTEEYDDTEILGSNKSDNLPANNLLDRNGKSLDIEATDNVTVSFVSSGETYSVGLEQVEQRVEQQLKQLSQKTFAVGSVNGQQGNDVIFEPNQNLGVDSPGVPVFTHDNGRAVIIAADPNSVIEVMQII